MSESKFGDRESLFAAKNDVRLELEALFTEQADRVFVQNQFRGKKIARHYHAWAVCSLPSGTAYRVELAQKRDDDMQVCSFRIEFKNVSLERASERANCVVEKERIVVNGGLITVPFIETEYRAPDVPFHKKPHTLHHEHELTTAEVANLAQELSASSLVEPQAALRLVTPEIRVPKLRQLNRLFGIKIDKDFLSEDD
jgi:hypothetical protein